MDRESLHGSCSVPSATMSSFLSRFINGLIVILINPRAILIILNSPKTPEFNHNRF